MTTHSFLLLSLLPAALLLPACHQSQELDSLGGTLSEPADETATADESDTDTDPSLAPSSTNAIESGVFLHPGTLNTQPELDFVRTQIENGAEPWASDFAEVLSIATEAPSGTSTVDSTDNSAASAMKADARGAYAAALAWHYTGESHHAENAIAILNSWQGLTAFVGGSDQDKLQAGWIGALFGPAADLMLSYEGWTNSDIEALRQMFRTAFYPQLEVASSWNGNVDLTQIEALLAIAVFNEDVAAMRLARERFDARVPRYFYLQSDGSVAGTSWHAPTSWVDGLTQESCRDNGHHAQYALSAALGAAEIAWHQGVNVFEDHQDRLTAAMELLATQLTTGSMQGVCADDVTTTSRFSTFEIGYNHYSGRIGLELPATLAVIEQEVRPLGRSDWNIFFETLTHAGVSEAEQP